MFYAAPWPPERFLLPTEQSPMVAALVGTTRSGLSPRSRVNARLRVRYSNRRAEAGSTLAARRAGISAATQATSATVKEAIAKLLESVSAIP